ncbi:MAG: ATPase/protein kinase [Bacteroidetes bacterium GWF2_33_38]|nr:MAG: ATPase/protein kinase [Bacteroidetes bacterium GWF2_33_38]OFY88519.1 MAG: ATPase/protein kinase [Bacteroidetes bacterium RIFOXYA2_FULL_33_7]HBX51669.1 methylmalonyl Co-A mutase-associated GTPase MeaB [Bacteroidales bacterium]
MNDDKNKKSALTVNSGIPQPPSISLDSVSKFIQKKKKQYTVDEYVRGIVHGDIKILSQAITIIESYLEEHQQIAREIIEKCLPYSGKAKRIGITGIPGVGKSTLIETFGKHITDQNLKLAVLAIDPSSEKSKGSILGDKTRMEDLSIDNNAFIRPSPSAGTLGGVAHKTRETIILCEAAGFDVIFIETVGVGQSETVVHQMVDVFLLLMLTGAGDELQGIKRGIMEMADLFVITKADGTNARKAVITKAQVENAIHFFPATDSGWIPRVQTCSAQKKQGISEIWNSILEYYEILNKNKFLENKRLEQSRYWMYEAINDVLRSKFYNNHEIKSKLRTIEADLMQGSISSYTAAMNLLKEYFKEM